MDLQIWTTITMVTAAARQYANRDGQTGFKHVVSGCEFIFYHFKLSVLFAILYIRIDCSYLNLGVN